MNSLFKLVLTIITGSVLFSACKSENKAGKLIPKDAALVIHVDGKSLTSKLTWDDIKQTSWFKEISSDTNLQGVQKELMQDPALTGFDDKGDFVFFIEMNPSGPGQFVAEGTIKDKQKFEAYYKKAFPGASVTKQDDISFLPVKEDGLLSWKDDKFIFVGSMNMPGAYGNPDMRVDTNLSMPAAGNTQRLIEASKKIFGLTADNSLSKDEKFGNLLKEEGDIHVYYNVEQMMKANMAGAPGMGEMLNLQKLVAGTVSTYTASFESGKIVIKSKYYASKDLAAIFKKYDDGKLDEAMMKNIPSQNIAGVIAINFKPEAIQEIVKLTGLDGMLNMLLAQAGVTMDDIIKANKGDLLVSVSDLNFVKDTTSYEPGYDTMPGYKKPQQMDFLTAVSIGDKPSFDKLVNAGRKMTGNKPSNQISYNGNDKYFALGNNPESVKRFLAGGSATPVFWDKFKGHGFGMFVDLQYIMKSIQPQVARDSAGLVVLNESMRMWENIYSLGDGYDDGALRSTTEINLVDKSLNSLKALNQYFDRIAGVMIAEKKKQEQRWKEYDSTRVPMDSITIP